MVVKGKLGLGRIQWVSTEVWNINMDWTSVGEDMENALCAWELHAFEEGKEKTQAFFRVKLSGLKLRPEERKLRGGRKT